MCREMAGTRDFLLDIFSCDALLPSRPLPLPELAGAGLSRAATYSLRQLPVLQYARQDADADD